ncbi:MAG: hypothetical protein H0W96_02560 [Solirubrobacterales bacterium]|nr:hypothetical protein [Solirubrobacterales bacterium]
MHAAVRRILVAATPAAAALALAAPAGAATLATSPCVRTVDGQGVVPITGTGFTPGAPITVKYATKTNPTPSFLSSATADPAGNFTIAPRAPGFNPFGRQLQTFGISATDGVNPALVAATTFEQVRIGYATNPSRGRPSRKVLHTVRGFPSGRNVYLHFRFGGKTIRNVKVGLAKGVCGVASKRMRLLPARSRPGTWAIYVDQSKAFSRRTEAQLKYSLTITRTFF